MTSTFEMSKGLEVIVWETWGDFGFVFLQKEEVDGDENQAQAQAQDRNEDT